MFVCRSLQVCMCEGVSVCSGLCAWLHFGHRGEGTCAWLWVWGYTYVYGYVWQPEVSLGDFSCLCFPNAGIISTTHHTWHSPRLPWNRYRSLCFQDKHFTHWVSPQPPICGFIVTVSFYGCLSSKTVLLDFCFWQEISFQKEFFLRLWLKESAQQIGCRQQTNKWVWEGVRLSIHTTMASSNGPSTLTTPWH